MLWRRAYPEWSWPARLLRYGGPYRGRRQVPPLQRTQPRSST